MHFCVYTHSPYFLQVLQWLERNSVVYDLHLNRTRFIIEESPTLTEFLLTWAEHCPRVDPRLDLATGFALTLDRDLGEL